MKQWDYIQKTYNKLAQLLSTRQATSDTEKPPRSTETTHSDKANYLLAFRTIITMLSFLQRLSPYARSAATQEQSLGPKTKEDRKVLKVLDALSSILVRQHEKTALVARPYCGSQLKVFASVVDSTAACTKTHLQPGVWNWVRNVTVAVNPRRQEVANATSLPVIRNCQAGVPPALIAAAAAGGASGSRAPSKSVLDLYLQNHW